jgi:hypothetical protein
MEASEESPTDKQKDNDMITAIIITLLIPLALGHSLRAGRNGPAVLRRPYNDRYNDAAGAREDSNLQ